MGMSVCPKYGNLSPFGIRHGDITTADMFRHGIDDGFAFQKIEKNIIILPLGFGTDVEMKRPKLPQNKALIAEFSPWRKP